MSAETPAPSAVASPGPVWPQIQQVNPADLAHLDTYTLSDNARRIHIVVPQLTGHKHLNDHLQQWANRHQEDFLQPPTGHTGEEEVRARQTPSLTATWAITGISPTMIGFYLESTENPRGYTTTDRNLLWYNPTDGKIVSTNELLTDTAKAQLPGRVAKALTEQKVNFEEGRLVSSLEDGSPAIGFTARGELYIGFDSYSLATGYIGAPSVAIEIPDESWLTDAGKAARSASLTPDSAKVPTAPVTSELELAKRGEGPMVDCRKEKCVALTFDDGPSSHNTPKLLDTLAKQQVPATFFVLGTQVKAFPEIVARATEEGHEIGSHSWRHANLTALSGKALKKDLADANKAIKTVTGAAPTLLRPPYGAFNSDVAKAAKNADLALVMWDVDTLDWEHRKVKKTVEHGQEATDGSIVLMHDIHETTIKAVPKLIKELREEGFTFVTVSELLGETKPGKSYFRAPHHD